MEMANHQTCECIFPKYKRHFYVGPLSMGICQGCVITACCTYNAILKAMKTSCDPNAIPVNPAKVDNTVVKDDRSIVKNVGMFPEMVCFLDKMLTNK